jgi:hypothetical protein
LGRYPRHIGNQIVFTAEVPLEVPAPTILKGLKCHNQSFY